MRFRGDALDSAAMQAPEPPPIRAQRAHRPPSRLDEAFQGIIGASIIADLLDDHELRTGYRQEAMFNAALSFSGKAISGLGTLLGGLIITLIAFPTNAEVPSQVSADAIFRLGLVVGVVVPLFYLIPIGLITRYRITREKHTEIQLALEARARETLVGPRTYAPRGVSRSLDV